MNNKILASVNGKNITKWDVDSFIQKLDPQTQPQYRSEEGQKQIIGELINQNLFFADAVDNKMDETPAYKTEIEKAREFILTQMNINTFISESSVSDAETKAHFEANPERFATQPTANTSHILVGSEELCHEIRAKIVSEEISFEDAAKENSTCPSKDNGGELGAYAKGQMVPEYDNVAFELPIGEISQPVKTQFGFHLIRVNEKKDGEAAEFEAVKQDVYKELLSAKQRESYIGKINEMRKKYQIETF